MRRSKNPEEREKGREKSSNSSERKWSEKKCAQFRHWMDCTPMEQRREPAMRRWGTGDQPQKLIIQVKSAKKKISRCLFDCCNLFHFDVNFCFILFDCHTCVHGCRCRCHCHCHCIYIYIYCWLLICLFDFYAMRVRLYLLNAKRLTSKIRKHQVVGCGKMGSQTEWVVSICAYHSFFSLERLWCAAVNIRHSNWFRRNHFICSSVRSFFARWIKCVLRDCDTMHIDCMHACIWRYWNEPITTTTNWSNMNHNSESPKHTHTHPYICMCAVHPCATLTHTHVRHYLYSSPRFQFDSELREKFIGCVCVRVRVCTNTAQHTN